MPGDDFDLGEEDEDSKEILNRYYFLVQEIILLLLKIHNIQMSLFRKHLETYLVITMLETTYRKLCSQKTTSMR